VCVGVVGLEDIEEAMDVCLRASLSRKLKFSNMNTNAFVFVFDFEQRRIFYSKSSSRFLGIHERFAKQI
jgi:hypothetical protein